MNEMNVKRIVALLEMKSVLLRALVEENDRLTRKVRDLEADYEFIVSGPLSHSGAEQSLTRRVGLWDEGDHADIPF